MSRDCLNREHVELRGEETPKANKHGRRKSCVLAKCKIHCRGPPVPTRLVKIKNWVMPVSVVPLSWDGGPVADQGGFCKPTLKTPCPRTSSRAGNSPQARLE